MKRRTRKYVKVASFLFSIVFIYVLFLMGANNEILMGNTKERFVEAPSYNSLPNKAVVLPVLETFYGTATSYVYNCPMCSGKLACKSSYDLSNGETHYYDETYGELNIVAADKRFPCGTVLFATINGERQMVIVLDRGVYGNKMDLLLASLDDCYAFGFKRNIKYEVVRYGF